MTVGTGLRPFEAEGKQEAQPPLASPETDTWRSSAVAERGKSDELVTLHELAVSNAYEIAALVAVLERKGILTHAEVLAEIARQKKGRARGR